MNRIDRELTKYTARKCIRGNHIAQPIIIKETSWLKLSLILIVIIIIAGGSAFAVATFGLAPEVVTNYICSESINQSFTIGVIEGAKRTSSLALTNSKLPIFLENGSIEFINIMVRPNG